MPRRPLVALLVLAALAPACQQVQDVITALDRPSVSIRDVRLQDLSLSDVTLAIELAIENPYSVDLPLLGVDYDLTSRGTRFLAGRSEGGVTVPAEGTGRYPFTAKIPFEGLLRVLTGIRPGTSFPYEAELGLFVDAPVVGELRLPISHSGEMPVPDVPDVSLAEIRWGEVSLNRVAAELALDIRNTNSFPLDLTRLDYGLSLAGVRVGSAGISRAARFAAGGSNRLTVPLSFSPLSAGQGLLNLLTGSGSRYRLEGALIGDTPFGQIYLPYGRDGETRFTR
jgi:LEA14-like dessication related protein